MPPDRKAATRPQVAAWLRNADFGGRERWERRLEGLARSLALDLDDQEDPEAPAAERLRRSLSDLENLRGYALPLLDDLARAQAF